MYTFSWSFLVFQQNNKQLNLPDENISTTSSESPVTSAEVYNDVSQAFGDSDSGDDDLDEACEVTDSGLYYCHQCKFHCSNITELMKHGKTPKHLRSIQAAPKCKICNQKLYRSKDWLKHVNVHSGKWTFPNQCSTCFQLFDSPSLLDRHAVTHLREAMENTNSTSYIGDLIPSASKSVDHGNEVSSLLKRIDDSSKNIQSSTCMQRKKKLGDQEEKGQTSKNHQSTHKNKKPVEQQEEEEESDEDLDTDDEADYFCPYCRKQCKSILDICHHCRRHHPVVGLSCDVCGEKYKRRTDMMAHRLTHNENDNYKYQCHLCSQKVSHELIDFHTQCHDIQDAYSEADRPDMQGKHYHCNICMKVFNNKDVLLTHIDAHKTCASGMFPNFLILMDYWAVVGLKNALKNCFTFSALLLNQ